MHIAENTKTSSANHKYWTNLKMSSIGNQRTWGNKVIADNFFTTSHDSRDIRNKALISNAVHCTSTSNLEYLSWNIIDKPRTIAWYEHARSVVTQVLRNSYDTSEWKLGDRRTQYSYKFSKICKESLRYKQGYNSNNFQKLPPTLSL